MESRQDAPSLALTARAKVNVSELVDHLASVLGEAFGVLGAAGTHPAGPPIAVYHSHDFKSGVVDIEIGVPVAGHVESQGRMSTVEVPGGQVLATIHSGPYEEIGRAFEALGAAMGQGGFVPAGPVRERYLVSPADQVDASEYRTEVVFPVVAATEAAQ